jgi:hypothetical protein
MNQSRVPHHEVAGLTSELDDANVDAVDSGSLRHEPGDAVVPRQGSPEVAEPFRTEGEPCPDLLGLLTFAGNHQFV